MNAIDEAALAAIQSDPNVTWIEDVLRFGDTDLNGHINNATFAVLCESGRVNLFQTALGDGREPGRYFVIAKLEIEFRAELHYPGRVRTGTWLHRVGTTSLGIAQVLLADDGRLAATSRAVCVSMDAQTRKPAPFSDPVRRSAEALLREDGA